MNNNLLTIVKQIVAGNGGEILRDPRRIRAFFADLAREEPKPLRLAFIRCIEADAYTALKTASGAAGRASRKASITEKLHEEHGLDPALCAEALDIIEAALFGESSGAPQMAGSAALSKAPKTPQVVPSTAPQMPQAPPRHAPQWTAPQAAATPAKKNAAWDRWIGDVLEVAVPVMVALAVAVAIMIGVEKIFDLLNSTPSVPGMVWIEGGTFTMGSPPTEPERLHHEFQHQVTLSGFYMGKYEVTQKEYREVMGTNPSDFRGENFPVECVSWYEAVEYCNRRSGMEGLTPAYTIVKTRFDPNNTAPLSGEEDYAVGDVRWIVTWNRNANGYRLPTEAEWEYACRAGTTTPFSTGNNITTDQANYDGRKPYNNNAKGEFRETTTPVGSFAPNPWGLYDMHGNVGEWCWDWYGPYLSGVQTAPDGVGSGSSRVVRGGSLFNRGAWLRSAFRLYSSSMDFRGMNGFRVVRPGFR